MPTVAHSARADWDFLAAAGLPLLGRRTSKLRPTGGRLVVQIQQAVLEVNAGGGIEDRERKVESLQALLLALKIHFPTFYRLNVSRYPSLKALVPVRPSGRTVKLVRLAARLLAEYL